MPLLQLQNITVAFGGPAILDRTALLIEPGERLALLGRNGSGKSTLLRVIQGTLEPDEGEVVRSAGLRVSMLEQQVPVGVKGTVLDVVRTQPGDPRAAVTAISRVGLDADAEFESLSAGLRRRVLLARALAVDPDLLLLDEPTNHLDVESIAWLEEFLRRQQASLLFVTHDRAFLKRLSTGILDLDRGQLTRYDADYAVYLERKRALLEAAARAEALFDKRLAAEESWIREGVRERRKRNQGRVGRLVAMRSERAERRDAPGTARIETQQATLSGRLVIEARDLAFSWEGQPIVRGLTTTIERGDRIGVIGPNGSGKTTLLRLLLGELTPTTGTIRRGTNLEIAYFDQLHATLDLNATAAENVAADSPFVMVNGKQRHIIGYLSNFLFTADQARCPVRLFSGGERKRLLLARLFASPSNVLVLDEPTNDLDVETLEVLEYLLSEYEGTVLVVSHDRALLDEVVGRTLVLEGGGVVGEYVGGYSEWLRIRNERNGGGQGKRQGRSAGRAEPDRPKVALGREEKQELRELPARIEKLEAERTALHARMADPAFFRQSGQLVADARAALARIEATIAANYARWEVLDAKSR